MKFFVILAASLIISGCAGAPKLSQEQIQQKYQSIAKLDQDVQSALNLNVNLLAPKGYSAASQELNDAYSAAQRDQTAAAEKYAKQGLDSINQANAAARKSSEILSDVLESRSKALKAGSQELFPKEMAEIEKDLSKAASQVESGDLEAAKRARPELLKSYSKY